MAVSATPVFVQTPKVTPQNFIQGTDAAGTFKTLFTAGANGSKVVAVLVSTTDGTAAHVLTLSIVRSAVNYPLVNYNMPINSGGDGAAAAIDLLAGGPLSLLPGLPVDSDGQKYIFLESGDTLVATFATALTAGKSIYMTTIGSHF